MRSESIPCGCGCGATFERFDKYGRQRTYLVGHNNRGKPAKHKAGPIAPRFWAKVNQQPIGCWEWIGYRRKPLGYGEMYIPGEGATKAHRISWELQYGGHPCIRGPIPDYIDVCHHCDNPPCVRPDHLFLGNARINAQDMAAKGRHFSKTRPDRLARGERSGMRKHPELVRRGEAHSMARLTATDVMEIRRLKATGATSADLAIQFKVTEAHIRSIIGRRTWKHVA